MKNVLILLDGSIANGLLNRLILQDTSHSLYDIVYTNDNLISKTYPKNFTFYKFDPSSYTKLEFLMRKTIYNNILVILSTKPDTIAVVDNIVKINPQIYFTVYNYWSIDFNNERIQNFDAIGILGNGLLEQLPNLPVIAQNIGLKEGEIMEISVPFGSSYAHRYVSSIAQKKWKMFALYRNNVLINIKPTLIIKPNDKILIIGKPSVLLQVHALISKSHGHFPMPFGRNIYVYVDMYLQDIHDIINCIEKALFLNNRFKNNSLVVKIVRPSTVSDITIIKDRIKNIKNTIIEFNYDKSSLQNIIYTDKKKHSVGLLIMSQTLLKKKSISSQVINTKVAIFKVGKEKMKNIFKTKIILNKTNEYEQISPIIFDISAQLKLKIELINADPIGDLNRNKIIDHFKNLSDIFNQKISITSNNKNPVKEISNSKNILQIFPLKHDMFKQSVSDLFSTDSDLHCFNFKTTNQILIPIIEDRKSDNRKRRKNDI